MRTPGAAGLCPANSKVRLVLRGSLQSEKTVVLPESCKVSIQGARTESNAGRKVTAALNFQTQRREKWRARTARPHRADASECGVASRDGFRLQGRTHPGLFP